MREVIIGIIFSISIGLLALGLAILPYILDDDEWHKKFKIKKKASDNKFLIEPEFNPYLHKPPQKDVQVCFSIPTEVIKDSTNEIFAKVASERVRLNLGKSLIEQLEDFIHVSENGQETTFSLRLLIVDETIRGHRMTDMESWMAQNVEVWRNKK